MSRWRDPTLGLAALTLLADLSLALPVTRYGAAFVLLWLLPGLAWAVLLTAHPRRPTAEDVAIGLGLGTGTTAMLTLLLHYIPGPLTLPALLVTVNALTFALLLYHSYSANRKSQIANQQISKSPFAIRHSLFIIPVAAFFRLLHLGYSEFQGDEGLVMMRAARAILGDEAQLFYHQKGPLEVLLPTATWTLSGTLNEWQARLPFACAGLLGVMALYLLGRRWFNGRSALVAALLLSINGYFIGFSRVVQYQSLVLATTTLALLALWRWSEGEGRRWLLVGAALLAIGLLAHYDAGLALPAVAYVVGRRLWATRLQGASWQLALHVLGAGALALGILALFYVPFALHPNFAKTLGYLGGARLGTGGPLYNNLLSSLPLATFYNSTYYLIGLACLLVAVSFLPFRRLSLLLPATCYLLLLLHSPFSILHSQTYQSTNLPIYQPTNLPPPTWTGPIFAILLAAILLSRRTSAASRAAWLWFGVPFLFYYFLVWDPRTHVLNAFPGATLLAAFALDHLIRLIPSSTHLRTYLSPRPPVPLSPRLPVSLSLLALFLFLAYYPYLMFIQHSPEIKRTWPAHQPALYWRPDVETPRFGYFGFPYRAGWKVIGVLVEPVLSGAEGEGVLSGTYASNEEQEIVAWYTRGAERTYCPGPEWYLKAQDVQDEVPGPRPDTDATYHLWGEVQVAGEPKLWIYRRGPSAAVPAVYHVEDYVSRFDAGATPANVVRHLPVIYTPAGHTLGDVVRLLGYRLDAADARPGGAIHLVLYWEALQPLEANYQVFNHLYDGTMWGQQDGTPGCALLPTTLWEPGQVVRDEYTVPIAHSTPVGNVPLLVGMYSLATGERLPVRAPDGASIGDAISLTVVTVR